MRRIRIGEKMQKRIVEFDIVKAVSIVLIVFSHLTYTDQFQRNFVSLFNVPIFFILSGYFFRNKTFAEVFSKSVERYLIPAYIFLSIDILKDIVIDKNILFFTDSTYFLKTMLFLGGSFKNYPIWFLLTLFCLIIIFNCLRNDKLRFLLAVLLILFNNFFTVSFDGYFWPISVLYGFPFFYVGYIMKKQTVTLWGEKSSIIFIMSFLYLLIITKFMGYNSMIEQYFHRGYLLFFISGVVGFYSVVSLSHIIVNFAVRNYLLLVGARTKFILLTHYYICRVLINKALGILGCVDLKYNVFFQIMVMMILFIMYVFFFEIFDKYCSDNIKKLFRKCGVL